LTALLAQSIPENMQQVGGVVAIVKVNDPIRPSEFSQFIGLIHIAGQQHQELSRPASRSPSFITLNVDIPREQRDQLFFACFLADASHSHD